MIDCCLCVSVPVLSRRAILIADKAGIALKTVNVEEVFGWLEDIIKDDKKAKLVIESINNVDVDEVFGWSEL